MDMGQHTPISHGTVNHSSLLFLLKQISKNTHGTSHTCTTPPYSNFFSVQMFINLSRLLPLTPHCSGQQIISGLVNLGQ